MALKPYDYFKYLLEEVPKYVDQKNLDFIDDLLPWSTQLPKSHSTLYKLHLNHTLDRYLLFHSFSQID